MFKRLKWIDFWKNRQMENMPTAYNHSQKNFLMLLLLLAPPNRICLVINLMSTCIGWLLKSFSILFIFLAFVLSAVFHKNRRKFYPTFQSSTGTNGQTDKLVFLELMDFRILIFMAIKNVVLRRTMGCRSFS